MKGLSIVYVQGPLLASFVTLLPVFLSYHPFNLSNEPPLHLQTMHLCRLHHLIIRLVKLFDVELIVLLHIDCNQVQLTLDSLQELLPGLELSHSLFDQGLGLLIVFKHKVHSGH